VVADRRAQRQRVAFRSARRRQGHFALRPARARRARAAVIARVAGCSMPDSARVVSVSLASTSIAKRALPRRRQETLAGSTARIRSARPRRCEAGCGHDQRIEFTRIELAQTRADVARTGKTVRRGNNARSSISAPARRADPGPSRQVIRLRISNLRPARTHRADLRARRTREAESGSRSIGRLQRVHCQVRHACRAARFRAPL